MADSLSEYFGTRLAAIRKALDLKQSSIGTALGCSNGAYSLYERNKREPTLPVLLNLCRKFGVSIDYLLGCFSPPPDLFADRLQDVLSRRSDKTLKEFAETFDLDPATEKLLVSGACFPSAKTLKNLCNYLNCSSDFLTGISDTLEQTSSLGSVLNTSAPRDPYSDLTPDQRIAIESALKAFREHNAAKEQEA